MTTRSSPPADYRPDLDGLRGVAIALVVVSHVWLGQVSGGVDVFLVLSGYFFIGSLLRHLLATSAPGASWAAALDPRPRLRRIARRLLPALVVVLLATVVLTAFVMPALRWRTIGADVVAAALYYENWHLAFTAQSYAAADAAVSPLQHLWSMSVQGQFFLGALFATLALGGLLKLGALAVPALRRPAVVRSVLASVLLGAGGASFAWAIHRHGVYQSFNYYDTFARCWELAAGGLLAVWLPRLRAPAWLRNALAAAALGVILSCGWWIDGVAEYPGPWALVPIGATLVLIWAGSTAAGGSGVVARLLARRPVVRLGSIAYSLYLWHWPLLIFVLAWRYESRAGFAEGAAVIAVSLVLATLTEKYIETPLRRVPPTRAARPAATLRPTAATQAGFPGVPGSNAATQAGLPDSAAALARFRPTAGDVARHIAARTPRPTAGAVARRTAVTPVPMGLTQATRELATVAGAGTIRTAPGRRPPNASDAPSRRRPRTPFTATRHYRVAVATVLAVATVVAGNTVVGWQRQPSTPVNVDIANLDPRLYPGARALLDGAPAPRGVDVMPPLEYAGNDWPRTSTDDTRSHWEEDQVKIGEYGDVTAARTIALAGGSHSEQWLTALDEIGRTHGFLIRTYLKTGCPLTTDPVTIWNGDPYPGCRTWVDDVIRSIAVDRPDFVFTTSTRPETNGDSVPPGYVDVFRQLRHLGQRVIAIRDNPWAVDDTPPLCLAGGRSPRECGAPRSALSPADPALALVPDFPNMSFLDLTDAMCDDEYCPAVVGNVLLWHDKHHLSSPFVRSLIPELTAELQPILRWW